ncbi:MAG: FGGY-family carbohydrate kinase, partial [Deltaproteobacteria bacterium]|nr:FGGY-family carbohydrate kinase [Deltaproteobacteria bacterium]
MSRSREQDGRLILAVDHGTSAMKAAAVDRRGRVVAHAFRPMSIHYLPGGGAEQDPGQWWRGLVECCGEVLSAGGVDPHSVAAICVSSTFSTTVATGGQGEPLLPALTWMDGRGAPHVRRMMAGFPSIMGYGAAKALNWIRVTGGGPSLSGKDDIGHALWVKHERPEIYERTRWFLPSKDWLNFRLCGVAAASYDSMSLFWVSDARDPDNIRYHPGLLRAAGLDGKRLPPMGPSTGVLGTLTPRAAEELGLPRTVKVVCGSPDHQCAGIGAGAVEDFDGHLYIGTSSWAQCTVPFKKTDVLHSIASLPTAIPGKYYCVNEQDMAGGCLEFLARSVLGMDGDDRYARIDELAAAAPAGARGAMFTPWLNGERTPVDDHHVRGGFFNLSPTTGQAELARAVLEGVALNTRWSLGYVDRFIGRRMEPLRFVGGGARSETWCQILADVLD